jgi:hypothetical protein
MAYDLLSGKQTPRDWSCGASVGTLDPNDFFFSPAEIEDEIRTLDGYAHSLDKDIRENLSKFPRSVVDEWVRFYREWSTFKMDTGFWKRHTRSARNKTIEYGNRIKDWQAKYTGIVNAPPTSGPLPDKPSAKYALPDFEQLKPWLIGLGVLVGAGYGIKILNDSGALLAIRQRLAPKGA